MYLLKSAAAGCGNLKRIDVICKSASEEKERYDEFMKPPTYRFKEARVEDYLSIILDQSLRPSELGTERTFDRLEAAHEGFMRGELKPF